MNPLPPVDVEPHPWRGLAWLTRRECHRVLKLWKQTILAPVISSLLFIIVFGLSLGNSIAEVNGFEYQIFIVPGLIAMAMAQSAYSNNSSTIFQARNDRYLDDILSAPMSAWQVHLGYLAGGAMRALIIGVVLAGLALPLTGAPLERPLELVLAVGLTIAGFGALGIIVGIYAQSWDNQSFINNIVILPLIFLGGVFYSVSRLGSPWEQISHLNPLFYVVEAIRFGFLGSADVSPWLSLGVVGAITFALLAWAQILFSSGYRLKP
ncbi:MAG TPA: ABC transporter permease [Solirubrobacterales bacterium]|nr:ABC transporter permease [Solirubrobacterales bacterium]